jgi:hypothetical protein
VSINIQTPSFIRSSTGEERTGNKSPTVGLANHFLSETGARNQMKRVFVRVDIFSPLDLLIA